MKINQALTILKNMKSKLKRTDEFMTSSIIHPEDTIPEYVFLDEQAEHFKLINDITKLKTAISTTNALTNIDTGKGSVSLQELILNNAMCRSELAFWTQILNTKLESDYRSRTKDTVKNVYATGFNKTEIKNRISTLENSKEFIESLIAKANAETDVIGITMQPEKPNS